MSTPLQVGRQIERTLQHTSQAIRRATKAALQDAGKVAREELHKASAPLPAGSDRQYSNFKRAGKLKVKVRTFTDAILVIPVGPWGIGRGKATGRGLRAWAQGRDATLTRLGREVPEQIGDAVEEAFRRG